jgi:fatty-acyl-CoA synthase
VAGEVQVGGPWITASYYLVIADVPTTSVGKFDKKVVRNQYADEELDVQRL